MHIHILGISGTFMAGIARIANQRGHEVSGSDNACYPPMSDMLANMNIQYIDGIDERALDLNADLYLIGNVMRRGHPVIECILNEKRAYMSGPEFLYHEVLKHKRVIAVAGTHGKTTVTSLITHVLRSVPIDCGYLIGGMSNGFEFSADLGTSDYFVIEADEYDTACFDKRSKFMHYHPEVLVINNLEFDHGDIFEDLSAIQTQFHHLLRLMPERGLIVRPQMSAAIDEVFVKGVWSHVAHTQIDKPADYWARMTATGFEMNHASESVSVQSPLIGVHNLQNQLSAMAVCHHVGLSLDDCASALSSFPGVRRRLEQVASYDDILLYDDFAHHPTAIKYAIGAIQRKYPKRPIISAVELGSNTMKSGHHDGYLMDAVSQSDHHFFYAPDHCSQSNALSSVGSIEDVVAGIDKVLSPNAVILMMSNRNFDNLSARLQEHLRDR